ncbi:MAG: globin domain-containing protein [Pseudomonadota bacterium]
MDNAERIKRVRSSWALAASDSERLSSLFYANLFRADASTRPLFIGDLTLQGRKLAQTLNFIVDHLEDEDVLVPAAVDLAVRHVSYGVVAGQYQSVGAALIETLDSILGDSFSKEDRHAWLETYTGLSAAMIEAAYPSQTAAKTH